MIFFLKKMLRTHYSQVKIINLFSRGKAVSPPPKQLITYSCISQTIA